MPSLDNPRLKLARAWHHLHELSREVETVEANKPRLVSEQFNPQERCYIYRFEDVPRPLEQLGLIIGDLVHNLRSALDSLAWQLALLITSTPHSYTIFPILKAMNPKAVYEVTRDLPPEAQKIIEGMQPYHRGNSAEQDPLWILNELGNVDKHRTITVLTEIVPVSYTIIEGLETMIDRLDDGQIIVKVPILPSPHEQFKPQVGVTIFFDVDGPTRGAGLGILRHIHDLIRDDVLPRFAGFFA